MVPFLLVYSAVLHRRPSILPVLPFVFARADARSFGGLLRRGMAATFAAVAGPAAVARLGRQRQQCDASRRLPR
jgi:hypothetical protein